MSVLYILTMLYDAASLCHRRALSDIYVDFILVIAVWCRHYRPYTLLMGVF